MGLNQKTLLVVVFLLMIAVEGVWQAGVEFRDGERPFFLELFLQPPTRANLRMFEAELEKRSVISQTLQPGMRFLQFVVMRETGDKALLGRDGWYFYRPGVRYLIEPWPPRNEPLPEHFDVTAAVVNFRDQLKARHIELMVVPLPGKASVYPDRLTSRASVNTTPVYTHTQRVIDELRHAGIEVIDLFEVFHQARNERMDLYQRQDTHWSPAGLHLAAKKIADRLCELGWIARGSSNYELQSASLSRYGDVVRMMDLPWMDWLETPERTECTQVIDAVSRELYRDDPESEIMLMGDSFLRIYEKDEPFSAGFASHLAYELKMPIASIVNDGGASTLVRQELTRKTELLQNKKVLIWEFVERDIRWGTEGWRMVKLF